jgi:hypothetical protein
MGKLEISTLVAAVLFILGCSPASPPTPTAAPAPVRDPSPPAKTVFEPLTRDLDRARAVQPTVDANTEATRRALDAQERGDNPP